MRRILAPTLCGLCALAASHGASGVPEPIPIPDLNIRLLNNPTENVEISFEALPDFRYTLRTSTDGITWNDLDSTPGFGSAFTFPHTGAVTSAPRRFYRVEVTPMPVFMETVTVGYAGNAADTQVMTDGGANADGTSGYGAVSYAYSTGKYEVTNAQYAQFLNAVAATADTYGLFNWNMGSNVRGGITRAGSFPNYTYAVKPFMGDKPVNYVNWYDCLRFCNWLHNGRPTGGQDGTTTEGGAYTLTGATDVAAGSDPVHGANGRNIEARYWMPSEDEWYKAAYHDPVNAGADGNSTPDYWLYPTRSDNLPTKATADLAGNINNDTANITNSRRGADWNGQNGNVTTVGSGGLGNQSFYGAFDMAGNLREWNEQENNGSRGFRGASWNNSGWVDRSSARGAGDPTASDYVGVGFRVAGPAP